MNRIVNIRGIEWKVYTESFNETTHVVFEKGKYRGNDYEKRSVPVRNYETVEQIYSKMYNHQIEKDDHTKWVQKLIAIPNNERHLHPEFAYFRRKSYGIALYFKSKWSPTGVENMFGYTEKEFKELGLEKFEVAERNDF